MKCREQNPHNMSYKYALLLLLLIKFHTYL